MRLGRPVIWTCFDNDMNHMHVDTRQYKHIVWKRAVELRRRVADCIRATILK